MAADEDLPAEFQGLSEEQLDEALEFMLGNAIFVLFHEAGHMLVSELELPVLGKEEDAVDALSSIMLLEARDETLDKALTDAADGWFLSDQQASANGADYAFWDEHSLDQQRAYSMVCFMVGQDPEGFKEFADSVELPEERRETCKRDYESALASWNAVLEPHLITNGSQSEFNIRYEGAKTPELKPYAELVKASDILSILPEAVGKTYQLEPGIELVATECGEPNAFWDAEERRLTYCYELAQYHAWLLKAVREQEGK